VNKSGADQLGAYLKRFSKFGSKQNIDYLNTSEVKARQWQGLDSDSPYHCNEYPSSAFRCPTLAHFKCGPMTSDQLVRRLYHCSVINEIVP
jgi:hypothetical protein